MTHFKTFLLTSAMLGLAACSQPASESIQSYADSKLDHIAADASGGMGREAAAGAAADISLPQIAYDYSYGFSAPSASLSDLLNRHQTACEKAGPNACLLISTSASQNPDDRYTNYSLELRVSQAWLKQFQTGLADDLKNTKGRMASHSVTSEDLSLNIVDTEARLKNKLALRDRLQDIIRQRPGKISELIEAETQLAQVQADIDAAQSALAVMKKRVATVHLTLSYHSEAVAASTSSFSPITNALNNVVGHFMRTLGFLIELFAVLLPLILLSVPAIWYGRKWLKARKAKRPKVSKIPDSGTPDS